MKDYVIPQGKEFKDAMPGKELVGYHRLYFNHGSYGGRWFGGIIEDTEKEVGTLNECIKLITGLFSSGCNGTCKDYFEQNFTPVVENRYLVQFDGVDNILLLVDTTYGNGDYPFRFYLYR